MPRGHARWLWRNPRLHGAGGAAPHARRNGAAYGDQAHPRARREGRRLHGGRLCARVRKPAVCMAQVIGALNLAAGLRDAYLAHSPVIAFTGGREPRTKFRKVYQEIDDVPAFEPVTKLNATVDDVGRFPDMVRQAFRVAVSGTPGPVHLQFRGNEGQIDADEAEMEPLVEAAFAHVPPFRP